jgi:DNA-binding transcriptional ArsR family regulator
MSTTTLDRQFSALADPSRRRLFESLVRGPKAVGRLAEEVPISRPAVSQHLRVLEEAGLVTHQTIGTRNIYRTDPDGVAALRSYLDTLWDEALENLKRFVETTKPNEP